MNLKSSNIRRRIMVIMLLFLQLLAGIIPTFAAYRQLTLHHNQVRVEATEDRLQNLLHNIPIHLEVDDDGIDTWHLTKNRRKTRYYISANAPQVSTPTRIVYLDTNLAANSIYLPIDKTGEYSV